MPRAILGIREAYLVNREAYLANDELLALVMEGNVGELLRGMEAIHMNRKQFGVESNLIN